MRLNPKPDFDTFSRSVVTMWKDLSTDGHPEESMRDIAADMLVIRGDNDFLTNLESMARLKSMIEKVNFLNVPLAEHVAFDESPEIVLRAMGKYFFLINVQVNDCYLDEFWQLNRCCIT